MLVAEPSLGVVIPVPGPELTQGVQRGGDSGPVISQWSL